MAISGDYDTIILLIMIAMISTTTKCQLLRQTRKCTWDSSRRAFSSYPYSHEQSSSVKVLTDDLRVQGVGDSSPLKYLQPRQRQHQHRFFFYSSMQQQSESSSFLPHDVGGQIDEYSAPIRVDDFTKLSQWEQECHAVIAILSSKSLISTDKLRRQIEDLTPQQYQSWTYYERWSAAATSILLESHIITEDELQVELFGSSFAPTTSRSSDDTVSPTIENKFNPGDNVRVKPFQQGIEWRRPHIRVPGYIYGVNGSIVDVCGSFGDPSYLSFGIKAPEVNLYRVRFSMGDIWPEQSKANNDEISIEIYEHWLEPSATNQGHLYEDIPLLNHDDDGKDCNHSHHHHGDGDVNEDHSHDPRPDVEYRAVKLETEGYGNRGGEGRLAHPGKEVFRALTKLLVEKELISYEEIRTMSNKLENSGQQLHGAALIVEAWMDPEFQEQLIQDPITTARTIGIETSNPNAPTVLTVVPNSKDVHNLIVCTLCSCYPSGLLGIAPSWYKSAEYRARAVREPREVLKEFGTHISRDKRIRIHDSTADHRYLVLPERPKGTENYTKEELRQLVTRDSMIGVTLPTTIES